MNRTAIIILVILLAGFIGIGTWRAASNGRLPINFKLPVVSAPVVNSQTKSVIQEENVIIDVVDKTSLSVISIGVNRRVVNPFDPYSQPSSQNSTIGTGFVVSQDKGVIVTNRHVVSDPNTPYTVIDKTGKKYEVIKIYRDPSLDLALVQVKDLAVPALDLGDSSKLKVGQLAIAIGNALGRLDNTVTTGIVSGLGRSVTAGDPFGGELEQLDNLIQTDAAINPGNSGGPLLNSSSQVIGVNVATTEGAQNIGFAIPINAVKNIVNEFVQNGTISRPYLGVRYRLITRDVAILNELPQGAYIQEVVAGSPADKAGVKAGEIITKIDNQAINSDTKVSEVVQAKKVGDQVNVTIWNEGNERVLNIALQETPTN